MRKPFVGILAVLVLGVLWAPWPAHAAFPGENGKIAFTRHNFFCPNGCDNHLMTMNPDGSGQAEIALGAHPAWSPNGQKLAFTDGFKVLVSNADGTGVSTVLNWGLNVGAMTWAADGQRLAAELTTCVGSDCRFDIYRFNLDGTGLVDLTPDPLEERNPSWSPDGSKIAFDRLGRILTMNAADGSGVTQLTSTPASDSNPSWSPDGARLAFTRLASGRSDIYKMNADGSAQLNLTAVQSASQRRDAAAWAPDGAVIAFEGGPSEAINLLDPNTGQETDNISQPPAGPTKADYEPDWQPLIQASNGYPRPRGATPVFTYLVPAYRQCTAPNSTHGSPLAYPSCGPPSQSSGSLTVGTPDTNGLPARSVSSVRLNVLPGNPTTTADEADIEIIFGTSDVRWASNLLPYNGDVSLRFSVRITDKDSSGANPRGTVTDVPLSFTAPCSTGTCGIDTTTDSLAPGTAKEGRRAIWELGQVQVYDGGPDADAGTEPNALFETQGVFVP